MVGDLLGAKGSHIVIGDNAGHDIDGQQNIAIGYKTGKSVKSDHNVAIGSEAGTNIGSNGNTLEGKNVSIGYHANKNDAIIARIQSTAIGSETIAADDAVAIGCQARANDNGSTAIGFNARATNAASVAIGQGARAEDGNFAIGNNSVATAAMNTGTGYLTGQAKPRNVVSVGDTGALHRIVNVADGSADQDAVTVAQLKRSIDDTVARVTNAGAGGAGNTGIFCDTVTTGPADNSITLRNTSGKGTIVRNVAPGVLDTDATNVKQIKELVDTSKTHYYSVKSSNNNNFNNDLAFGVDSMAAGVSIKALGERSVAIGNNNEAQSTGSITLGVGYSDGNAANGLKQTLAITGYEYNMAIGAGAQSAGNSSIAMGTLATSSIKNKDDAVDKAIAIGYSAGVSDSKAIAIGSDNSNNPAGTGATITATNSSVFGNQNRLEDDNNTIDTSNTARDLSDTQILGSNVTATLGNSVYLGSKSAYVVAGASTKGMDAYTGNGTYNYAGGTPAGVVTVGSVGKERRIQNVAAGLVSTTSTDAINGSQLYNHTLPLCFGSDNSTIGATAAADNNVIHRGSNQAMSILDDKEITRIKYKDEDGTIHQVATKDDGMKYGGDSGNVIKKKLNTQVNVKGGISDESKLVDEANIGVVSDGTDTLKLRLAKDLQGLNTVNANTVNATNVNATTVKTGDSSLTNNGLTIENGTAGKPVSVTKDGLDNGGNKIVNVAPGEVSANSTDAVNGSQLYGLSGRVSKLGTQINRVGASAAALAGLHPLDFDPDDKWDFAASYGNYKGTNAVAIDAYYRLNEDTMVSVGGSFSGGENMLNVGVSWKFSQNNTVSRSRVSVTKDVMGLKQQVEMLTKKLEAYESGQAPVPGNGSRHSMVFPDVPENHWAYQYVKTLGERGYLQGYPDGEFKGNRALTRYEYAAIIYRALQNGAPADGNMARSVDEFGSELEFIRNIDRFRVDRVSGGDNDCNKVERVRINDKDDVDQNDYRDNYGSRIEKTK